MALARPESLPYSARINVDYNSRFRKAVGMDASAVQTRFRNLQAFPDASLTDVLVRWANVFREEIDVVRRTRNAIVHALSISDEDIKGAILAAARLLAYLHFGLGDVNLEADPLILRAFATIGAEPPQRPY